MRLFMTLAILVGAVAQASAADLTKFSLKCINRGEASADDVYLEFIRDGQPVVFTNEHQQGTSHDNSVNMTDGNVLTLDAKTLAALKFEKTLTIHIKEKDVTTDELYGTMNLAPGDVTNTFVCKGGDAGGEFEYHVDYSTTK